MSRAADFSDGDVGDGGGRKPRPIDKRKLDALRRLQGHGLLHRDALADNGLANGARIGLLRALGQDAHGTENRLQRQSGSARRVHASPELCFRDAGHPQRQVGQDVAPDGVDDPVEARIGRHEHVDVGVHRLNLSVCDRLLPVLIDHAAVDRVDACRTGHVIQSDRSAEGLHGDVAADVHQANLVRQLRRHFDVNGARHANAVGDAAGPAVPYRRKERAHQGDIGIPFETDDSLLAGFLQRFLIHRVESAGDSHHRTGEVTPVDLDAADRVVNPERAGDVKRDLLADPIREGHTCGDGVGRQEHRCDARKGDSQSHHG